MSESQQMMSHRLLIGTDDVHQALIDTSSSITIIPTCADDARVPASLLLSPLDRAASCTAAASAGDLFATDPQPHPSRDLDLRKCQAERDGGKRRGGVMDSKEEERRRKETRWGEG